MSKMRRQRKNMKNVKNVEKCDKISVTYDKLFGGASIFFAHESWARNGFYDMRVLIS